jgi:small-conductance mechanosensitive channel
MPEGTTSEELLRLITGERLVALLFIIGIAVFAGRGLNHVSDRLSNTWPRHRLLLKKINAFSKFGVFLLAAGIAMTQVFRLSDEAYLALGGVLAVAIGFAFKDLATSLIAGIIILLDRPFMVGDRVTIGSYYGEVRDIGLRSVRIVTLDDSVVSIPNNRFLTDEVASGNWGALDMMVEVHLHIDPASDLGLARRIVREAVVTSRYVYLDKPVIITLEEQLTGALVTMRVAAKAYVFDCKYEKAFATDVIERSHSELRKRGIFPASRARAAAHAASTSDAGAPT